MRFSVIVPVYQGEKYIDRCLKSILGQKSGGCGFEVIIVDDGSTDATAEICRRYSEQDSRVKVIRRSENRGLVAARSEGVSAAKGSTSFLSTRTTMCSPDGCRSQRRHLKPAPT